MDAVIHHIRAVLFIICIFCFPVFAQFFMLPVAVPDRHSMKNLTLTSIGEFGVQRPDRSGIPAHLHTGIDIQRPNTNYLNEPIYPIAPGRVISVREDGPYAQVIVEHIIPGLGQLWSVYEHVAGISCAPADSVNPMTPIARFMNRPELQRYGYQFDHVHLEILKRPPRPVLPTPALPQRFFTTYNLVCYGERELSHYYLNPIQLFIYLEDSSPPAADGRNNKQDNLDPNNQPFSQ